MPTAAGEASKDPCAEAHDSNSKRRVSQRSRPPSTAASSFSVSPPLLCSSSHHLRFANPLPPPPFPPPPFHHTRNSEGKKPAFASLNPQLHYSKYKIQTQTTGESIRSKEVLPQLKFMIITFLWAKSSKTSEEAKKNPNSWLLCKTQFLLLSSIVLRLIRAGSDLKIVGLPTDTEIQEI